jgi:hypothetical protein
VTDETADEPAVCVGDDVDDVAQPGDLGRLLHSQAHRVFRLAHDRFGQAHRGFPLVAIHHLLARDARENDLGAATEAFYTVRHDAADAQDEVGLRQQAISGDARAIFGAAEFVHQRLVLPIMLMNLEAAVELAQLEPQLVIGHAAMRALSSQELDVVVGRSGGGELRQDVWQDFRNGRAARGIINDDQHAVMRADGAVQDRSFIRQLKAGFEHARLVNIGQGLRPVHADQAIIGDFTRWDVSVVGVVELDAHGRSPLTADRLDLQPELLHISLERRQNFGASVSECHDVAVS